MKTNASDDAALKRMIKVRRVRRKAEIRLSCRFR
jgi:hypothetical protein